MLGYIDCFKAAGAERDRDGSRTRPGRKKDVIFGNKPTKLLKTQDRNSR